MSTEAERRPLSRSGKTGSTHGTFGPGGGRRESLTPSKTPEEGAFAAKTEKEYTFGGQLSNALTSTWQLKLLLVFVPIALVGRPMGFSDGILFFSSFFGLVPLAALLGDFTEDVALRSNDVIGALINVTFGNATELIISIMALRAGMYELIKLSLIGSILGNMLLVLGSGFMIGGLKYHDMTFNTDAANTYAPLLLLSVMSFVIPSGFSSLHQNKGSINVELLTVSRQIALVTAVVYVAYIVFQLYTHKSMFDVPEDDDKKEGGEEEEEEEGPAYTMVFAVVGLGIVSTILSILSDVLVGSLQGAAAQWGLPEEFIGIILVPIVGNAAEHASAILMAAKNKLDISIGVAIGSSIQISLFVMPVLVLVGWVFGVPLDMNFHPFPTALLFISVLVTTNATTDGSSNWLEGMMLVAAYIMVALTFLNAKFDLS